MIIDFQHNQSSHCENGVISNLLKHNNVHISEPMIFGIGAGYFFGYMPFLKLNGIPIVTFRPVPGTIFKRACKQLGVKIESKKFRNKEKAAMLELDRVIASGIPVGLQVGAFDLEYFPRSLRFHFNMHNIVVYGIENGRYLISDPVLEDKVSLSYDELVKVRYAKGPFSPNGKMYYPIEFPKEVQLDKAIKKGIKKTCNQMLTIPVPLFGAKGIRYLAKKYRKWPEKLGKRRASMWSGQLIRMMEEIGTGGAGFRYIYAAFLEESAPIINEPKLLEVSKEMTAIGDRWRDFSYHAARNVKNRATDVSYDDLADILVEIADREEAVFKTLQKLVK
jgi:hypothetical protein